MDVKTLESVMCHLIAVARLKSVGVVLPLLSVTVSQAIWICRKTKHWLVNCLSIEQRWTSMSPVPNTRSIWISEQLLRGLKADKYQQPLLLCRPRLEVFYPIKSQEQQWAPTMMLLADILAAVNPRGDGWSWSRSTEQARQSEKRVSLWTSLTLLGLV